ncbi:MAG: NAD(P)-dependent oxidoreductase [Pseudorhodoplanes sp.]
MPQRPRALYYSMMQYQPANRARLDEIFDVTELPDPGADKDEDLAEAQVLFAPLGYRIDAARMDRCPRLKAIVSNTTGIPHIDAKVAAQRGIAICALHDEQAFLDRITPTAEHAIGLIIAAWRRIPAAHAAASAGRWDRRPWGAPAMLSRLRLGIVGYGRLGRKVGAIARAMEMKVAYYDPSKPDSASSLLALARTSDILSLHVPALPATQNLVSREMLEALPRGAMVVNTARGEVLDTDALIDLLESGHLRAAALDVVKDEYDPGFQFVSNRIAVYARTHDNLVLTPHIGGSTVDAWSETERHVIEKAARIFAMGRT